MVDLVSCEGCGASVSFDMAECPYCGDNLHSFTHMMELNSYKKHLDAILGRVELKEFMEIIGSSKFKDHSIVQYRLALARLIDMGELGIFLSSDFIEIIDIINRITEEPNDYWSEFNSYFTNHFPYYFTEISSQDLYDVSEHITYRGLDANQPLLDKLRKEMAMQYLGADFQKEYFYYTAAENYINDPNFLRKRDYLVNKLKDALKDNYS